MNEGRNQTIGIILISIIVYLLAARFFQRFENTDNEIVNETVEVDSIQSPADEDRDITNLVGETPPVVVIAENGDTLEIDAASYAAQNKWGAFYPYAAGIAEDIVIENDLLRVVLHSK
jgi:predicted nuclease of predicted toxin-antitoxin system